MLDLHKFINFKSETFFFNREGLKFSSSDLYFDLIQLVPGRDLDKTRKIYLSYYFKCFRVNIKKQRSYTNRF